MYTLSVSTMSHSRALGGPLSTRGQCTVRSWTEWPCHVRIDGWGIGTPVSHHRMMRITGGHAWKSIMYNNNW